MQKNKKYYFFIFPLIIITLLLIFGYRKNNQNNTKPLSLNEFNKLINSNKNVLVYFHASWCQVCVKMGPIIDEVDSIYKSIKILRIDTDVDTEIAKKFEIDGLPLLVLYKNGHIDWTYLGLIEKNKLEEKINYLK